MKPQDIEKESFAIITKELGDRVLDPGQLPVVKRVIHTSADFEYADTLYFSSGVVEKAQAAFQSGAAVITDTRMAQAGINKKALAALGCACHCFMDDEEVAESAKQNGTTRAVAAVDKAVALLGNGIYVFGNAPTALLRLCQLVEEQKVAPLLVVGAPVGFVNVVESKEKLMAMNMPCILTRGRKGGSNVAAAICNALLYETLGDHRK